MGMVVKQETQSKPLFPTLVCSPLSVGPLTSSSKTVLLPDGTGLSNPQSHLLVGELPSTRGPRDDNTLSLVLRPQLPGYFVTLFEGV